MELNLMSTDAVFANINVVFDDSIFQIDDDTAFVASVSNRFNADITFPSYADSIRIGGTPSNYNQPLNIPNSVTNLSSCFNACSNFNQPVIIPNNVKDISSMFRGCTNFNQVLNIPNGVTRMTEMFSFCSDFNSPINISPNILNCERLFYYANNFNSGVTISDGATTCVSLFQYADNFNRPLTIPDSVISCNSMIYAVNAFNQPITFGNNLKYCGDMLHAARAYNCPTYVGRSVVDCHAMLAEVTEYNSVTFIPQSVQNTYQMFYNANSVPYNFSNGRYGVFDNSALKQPIYFLVNNISNAQQMFTGCNSMAELYVTGVKNNVQLTRFMRNNGTVRCNIYTDDGSLTYIRNTPILINGGTPTWTEDSANNCIYNTGMNLYMYNTWDGSIPNLYRLNYYTNDGNRFLHTDYVMNGGNGSFVYGDNNWSNVPNGTPIADITNNISADTNVYYAGEPFCDWIRQERLLTDRTWGENNGTFNGAGASSDPSGIVINGAVVSSITFNAESGYGYIQTGKCTKTATLPTIITAGTGRINYATSQNGTITLSATEDAFIGGYNLNVSYTVVCR